MLTRSGQWPHLVGPWARSLLIHEDEWTRAAGLALCLTCGEQYADLDDLKHRYPDLVPRRRDRSPFGGFVLEDDATHRFRTIVLLGATELLLAAGLTSTVCEGVQRMLREDTLPSQQAADLVKLLRESHSPELMELVSQYHNLYYARLTEHMSLLRSPDEEAEFLDMVLTQCRVTDHPPPSAAPFIHLALLVHALRIGEMTAGNVWKHWQAPGREAQAGLAIRGTMLAAGIEAAALSRDVLGMREALRDQDLSVFSLIVNFPVQADWTKTRSMPDADLTLLVSGINHPCKPVAVALTEMVLARTPGEINPEAFRQVLQSGRSHCTYILAQIGEELWGRRTTLGLFCWRLEQELAAGCKHLLAKLPGLSEGGVDDRVLSIIRRALTANDADVAVKAAELCLDYVSSDSLVPDLRFALAHWKAHEEPYPKKFGMIPTSPRSILVKVLTRWQALTIDELFSLHGDVRGDVREAAETQLLDLAREDGQISSRLLDGVQAGRVGLSTLSKKARMPSKTLSHEYGRLLNFLKSENRDLRIVMTHALSETGFESVTARIDLISGMLNDSDPDVRHAARHVLVRKSSLRGEQS